MHETTAALTGFNMLFVLGLFYHIITGLFKKPQKNSVPLKLRLPFFFQWYGSYWRVQDGWKGDVIPNYLLSRITIKTYTHIFNKDKITEYENVWIYYIIIVVNLLLFQSTFVAIFREKLLFRRIYYYKDNLAINLTLCVPCIILQCVNDQRDAQFL